MHLLNATAGAVSDGTEPVDLAQTPGDVVVLTSADTELACLSRALPLLERGDVSLRLANFMALGHNMSVDLYVESVIERARYVVVRLLGGVPYWRYGIEQIHAACRERGIPLAVVPGTMSEDPELDALCTVDLDDARRVWRYFSHGGIDNARRLIAFAAARGGFDTVWEEPQPLASAGHYTPPGEIGSEVERLWKDPSAEHPSAAIVFYRALVQAGTTGPVDALCEALLERGIAPRPIFVASLKDPQSKKLLGEVFEEREPDVVLNATSFAASSPGSRWRAGVLDGGRRPVIQVIFGSGEEADWRERDDGLSPKDLAMWVALPEVDGRIVGRAVAFKDRSLFDEATQCPLVDYQVIPDRVAFTAELARRWSRLARAEASERRVAFVLSSYPGREGRLANAVGLDTPASIVASLESLAEAGYDTGALFADGDALIRALEATGEAGDLPVLPLDDYQALFAALPESVQNAVRARWGEPEADPCFNAAAGGLSVRALQLGKQVLAVQPARGSDVDVSEAYHSGDLPPTHGYIAFYLWLRHVFDAHALVQFGTHGTLEWLPGKSVALSQECFPDAVLGPLPNLYPFIVNDPGEGTQAKRRSHAVILGHMTPPLTRAETYGPLQDLEHLVDEYYDAAGLDRRRLEVLRGEILDLMHRTGLARDCGIEPGDDDATMLNKVDAHLCDLKDLQIRDGLHILGRAPQGRQRRDLLIALTRQPRGEPGAGPEQESLLRALSADLGLGSAETPFDPLACDPASPWEGPRPDVLEACGDGRWRNSGDTLERLEALAGDLIVGEQTADPAWERTLPVLDAIHGEIEPLLDESAEGELRGLLDGLAGRFIPPGGSGAPTRGRLDVLPTGRNFYSVDTRTVPTATAWTLGWASAAALLDRYRQDHGGWPKRLVLSVWGTANMRTGGDDLAQAMALLGVRPTWDTASRRLTGFEIMPASVLARPRVDVTLRISGFFRDAFPYQIDLFDSAVRAVAQLDEPEKTNPLAAQWRREREALVKDGMAAESAERSAGYRVFGAQPGSYGAGLQDVVDSGRWQERGELAEAYLANGGHAYGRGAEGRRESGLFRQRMAASEAVVHNGDSAEQDILEGNDYYQFEGGAVAAIAELSGREPAALNADHSNPAKPTIRSLDEEIARVVRGRAANPKWIAGMIRHGYKGASELAATVDSLFGYAATTKAVGDQHFEALADAYLGDEAVRDFLRETNPGAGIDISERLRAAMERGFWQPRSNSAHVWLEEVAEEMRAHKTMRKEEGS